MLILIADYVVIKHKIMLSFQLRFICCFCNTSSCIVLCNPWSHCRHEFLFNVLCWFWKRIVFAAKSLGETWKIQWYTWRKLFPCLSVSPFQQHTTCWRKQVGPNTQVHLPACLETPGFWRWVKSALYAFSVLIPLTPANRMSQKSRPYWLVLVFSSEMDGIGLFDWTAQSK